MNINENLFNDFYIFIYSVSFHPIAIPFITFTNPLKTKITYMDSKFQHNGTYFHSAKVNAALNELPPENC